MTHVFHRHLRQAPPVAAGAAGMTIRDAAGRDYLDASGGAAVSSLGHGHPDVIAAMHAQIDRLRLRPHQLLHQRGRRAAGRRADRAPRPPA